MSKYLKKKKEKKPGEYNEKLKRCYTHWKSNIKQFLEEKKHIFWQELG